VSPAPTVFIGSGGFGVESLRRLAQLPEVRLAGVVTAPPRPAGRGGRRTPTEIEVAALGLGARTILTPERLRAPDAVAAILGLEPELAVLADYGQIVPAPILELPFGALNLHPSLLPRHRGATPIPATILGGDPETGVTLFRMDSGLDTGPIVATERLLPDGTETAPVLETRLGGIAAGLLERSVGPWLRGEIEPRSQPADGATMTRLLRREDGRLDPALPAVRLERQVRAFQPWPGSYLDTAAGRVAVWRASVVESRAGTEVAMLAADGRGLALVTVEGALRLEEVQPAGGRRMSGEELRRGRGRDLPGTLVV